MSGKGCSPGPWRVSEYLRNKRAGIVDLHISDVNRFPVAVIREANGRLRPRADARLIAAAPQLLEALAQIREMGYDSQVTRATETVLACIRVAEAAISLVGREILEVKK